MHSDSELLRQYAEDCSEEAFGEIVARHLGLVYSAALRQVAGDAHLAQEVAQEVFADLARKARSLTDRPVLNGWLYTSTHYAAAKAVREERRRRTRETEVHAMNEILSDSLPVSDWNRLRPVLDEVMHELDAREREIVLLRFFEELPLAAVGEQLGLSANTTAKRVERVLEKLRGRLAQRGVTSTSAALALLLADQAVSAAPAGLEGKITIGALFSAAKGGGATAGIFQFMGTKTSLGIVGVLGLAGLLGTGGIGTALYERQAAQHAQASLRAAQDELRTERARLQSLTQGAEAAAARVTAVETDLARTDAAIAQRKHAAGAARLPPGQQPRIDGKNFLATFGQVRGMLMDVGKAQLARMYSPFYRSAGLSPAQIAQFENRTSAYFLEDPVVTPRSIQPAANQLPDVQLREILGDDGLQKFQDYQRMVPAQLVAIQMAVATGYAGEPLSSGQSDALLALLAKASAAYQSGGPVVPAQIDWNAVGADAKGVLSPTQLAAVQGVLLKQQLAQAVNQAQAGPGIAKDAPAPTP